MECFSKMSIFNCATTTLFCLRNPTNLKKKHFHYNYPKAKLYCYYRQCMITVFAQYIKGNGQEPWLTVMFLYQLTGSKPKKKLQIYKILQAINYLLTAKYHQVNPTFGLITVIYDLYC